MELNSRVCKECEQYSGVYGGLCGNCILKIGKSPEDYDPGLKVRRELRDRQVAEGRFPTEALELARLDAMDRPTPRPAPGLHKKDKTDSKPIGPEESTGASG